VTSTIYDRPVIELGHVTDRKAPYRYAAYTRVAFSDTDAQDVVYYGRYMPYFDLARVEYHRHLGAVELRGQFAMRASSVEYHAPARFDDLLEIFVRIERIGTTSITYDLAAYDVGGGGDDHDAASDVLLATAKQTTVFIDPDTRRPMSVPEPLRELVAAFEGEAA
jgi:YbgC/YbaW family acyl-CoA thioester hydrolase